MKTLRYALSAACVVSLLFCLTACGKTYDSRQICDEFIGAVVEVQVRDETGEVVGNATGTVIGVDGVILTNRHVVRRYDFASDDYVLYDSFFIRRYNEDEFTEAEFIRFSPDSDLALLRAPLTFDKCFALASDARLQYGEIVHTLGNGNGYGLAYAQGCVAAPLREVVYENVAVLAIQLGMTINEGNSGGPLINERGELVGITTFRLRDKQNNVIYGTSFALPVTAINEFLSAI